MFSQNIRSVLLSNYLYWATVALLFTCILLRAINIPLYFDEISTYFFYIQSGKFVPFESHLDANNHFVNSTLSYLTYKIFGNSPIVLRLPNVLCFLVLAHFTFKIEGLFEDKISGRLWSGCQLFCVYVAEYFAISRGYGMSIAFLTGALFYLLSLNRAYTIVNVIGASLMCSLALWANLSLLLAVLVIGFLTAICIGRNQIKKTIKLSGLLGPLFFIICLVIPVLYAILFSFELKQEGRFYHGYELGFFQNSLFGIINDVTSNAILSVVFIIAAIFLIVRSGFERMRNSKTELLSWTPLLVLIGTIVGIFLLNWLFEIRYPKDRTGIHLIFLILLPIYYFGNAIKSKNQRIVLFVPFFIVLIGGIAQFNLSYVHGWRLETVSEDFYHKMKTELSGELSSVNCADNILGDAFNQHNYYDKGKLNMFYHRKDAGSFADFVLTNSWDKYDDYTEYDTLLFNEKTSVSLLKRKDFVVWENVQEETIPDFSGTEEFHDISEYNLEDGKDEAIKIDFDFSFRSENNNPRYWVVAALRDSLGRQLDFVSIDIQRYQPDYYQTTSIFQSRVLNDIPKEAELIKFYVWNIEQKSFYISDFNMSIYSIED